MDSVSPHVNAAVATLEKATWHGYEWGKIVLRRDAFSAMFLLHSQQVGERIPG